MRKCRASNRCIDLARLSALLTSTPAGGGIRVELSVINAIFTVLPMARPNRMASVFLRIFGMQFS
jgi:hypothetical protein